MARHGAGAVDNAEPGKEAPVRPSPVSIIAQTVKSLVVKTQLLSISNAEFQSRRGSGSLLHRPRPD